jgi:hypothetical protein
MNSVLDKVITVQAINFPPDGKKRGTIRTTEGQTLGVWPEKISLFRQGGTYDVAIEERNFNGATLRNITDARPLAAPPAAAAEPRQQQQASTGNGNGNGNAGYYRPTAPVDAERMFVCSILNAFVQAGKVELEPRSLAAATMMLRRLWAYAFVANGGTFEAANERHSA